MSHPPAGWLNNLPDRWALTPAKALFSERREPSSHDDVHLTPSQTYGVLPQTEYMAITGNRVVLNLAGSDKMKHVEPDDFVIHLRSFQGGIEHSPARGKVSMAYTVLTPRQGIDPRYYRWLLKSAAYVQELRTTTNQLRDGQSIKYGNFAQIALPRPPDPEQRVIADFLDRETARIDTLIAKQEQLITTLRERRQALIDYSFSSADEGGRMQLRRAILFLTSGSRGWGDYYADEGDRFVRIGNLPRSDLGLRGRIQYVNLPAGVTEGERARLRAEDLLFSITAYLGSVAVVDDDWADAYVSQHVALCRVDESVLSPRFVGYYMLTTAGQRQLKEGAYGGTKLQLALADIRGLRVPTIPLDRQRRIVSTLVTQTAKIDALIEKAEQFIELSKERRSALITAAVTGQMDVRGEVA